MKIDPGVYNDPYLPGGIPTSSNLLESLNDVSFLNGVGPRLSTTRLSRIGSIREDIAPDDYVLKVLPRRSFRAIPPLTARVRYSKSSTLVRTPTVFASLDIETAPFSSHLVTITAIKMDLPEGSSQDLSAAYALKLPISCRPKDALSFLFYLIPTGCLCDSPNTITTSKTLEICIEANVAISETCRPRIQMRWKTAVDFSTTLNRNHEAFDQALQRIQRTTSLFVKPPLGGQSDTPVRADEGVSAGEVLNSGQQRTTLINDLGITLTITAPDVVRVGLPFHWDMFLVNRSNQPRRLAILVVLQRKRGDFNGHLSRPSTSSTVGRKDTGIAEHYVDENLLYAMQRNAGREPPQIVSLNTDIKIG